MLLSLCAFTAVAAFAPQQSGASKVQDEVRKLIQSDPSQSMHGLQVQDLGPESIPYLTKALPLIERGAAFLYVAEFLRSKHAVQSIDPVIASFNRTFSDHAAPFPWEHPAIEVLASWWYEAFPQMFRAAASGSHAEKLGVAKVLSRGSESRPIDPRLPPVLLGLSKNISPELRRATIPGIWYLVTTERGWIDGNWPFDLDCRPAMERLIEMALDPDPGVREEARTRVEAWLGSSRWRIALPPRIRGRERQWDPKVFQSPQPYVRAAVLALMGPTPDLQHLNSLSDTSPVVRRIVLKVFESGVDPKWIAKLEQLGDISDMSVRADVASALGFSYSPAALPWLKKALGDGGMTAKAAKRAIVRIRGPKL